MKLIVEVTHFWNSNFKYKTKRPQIPQKLVYKKFYVHDITAINLSKIYFLKKVKKTCKPNNRDLNRDWTRSCVWQFCCKVKFMCILKVYKYFVALKRENNFRVDFFLSEFHLDILIWKFSVAGQNFIAIPKSILELFRKYLYFRSRSFFGGGSVNCLARGKVELFWRYFLVGSRQNLSFWKALKSNANYFFNNLLLKLFPLFVLWRVQIICSI